jgi:hypothetical protein
VADEDDVLEILRNQIVDDRLDRVGKADRLGVARPVAGDRRRMHFVAGGADRRRGRLKLGAGMPGAMNKHVSRHRVLLPKVPASKGSRLKPTLCVAELNDRRQGEP